MVQQVTDESGQIHEFPDEATSDDINTAMAQVDAENLAKKQISPGFMSNFTGGMLSGITGIAKNLPDLSKLISQNPKLNPNGVAPSAPLVNSIDPYKAMGTTNQPITSSAGLAQTMGQLFTPGMGVAQSEIPIAATAETLVPAVNKVAGSIGNAANAVTAPLSELGEKITSAFSPGKQSDEFLQNLGSGAANTQESSESVIKDIQDKYNQNNDHASSFLDYPLKIAGQEKIYPEVDPLTSTQVDPAKSMLAKLDYLDLGGIDKSYAKNPDYDGIGDLKMQDVFNDFRNNMNFSNAQKLQSELGVMMGNLQKIPGKTIQQTLQLKNIKNARDSLNDSIMSFLKNRDQNSNDTLAPMYQQGVNLYRDTVAPYLSSPALRQITRGGKTMINNVENIFKNPTDIVDPYTGQTTQGPVNKILSDLPQQTKNQILFNKVGANINSKNPQALVNAFNNADQKGFSHLVTPQVRSSINNIKSAISAQNILKSTGKVAGGAAGLGAAGAGIGLGYNMFHHLMNNG